MSSDNIVEVYEHVHIDNRYGTLIAQKVEPDEPSVWPEGPEIYVSQNGKSPCTLPLTPEGAAWLGRWLVKNYYSVENLAIDECQARWPHLLWTNGRHEGEYNHSEGPWSFLVYTVRGGRVCGFLRNVDQDENVSSRGDHDSLNALQDDLADQLAHRRRDDLTAGFRRLLFGDRP